MIIHSDPFLPTTTETDNRPKEPMGMSTIDAKSPAITPCPLLLTFSISYGLVTSTCRLGGKAANAKAESLNARPHAVNHHT